MIDLAGLIQTHTCWGIPPRERFPQQPRSHVSAWAGRWDARRARQQRLRGMCRMLSNQRKQQTGDGTLNPVLRMLAGAVAGIIAMSSTYHLDMVRGRLTVQEGSGSTQQYRGIMHAYQDIIQKVRTLPQHSTRCHSTAQHTLPQSACAPNPRSPSRVCWLWDAWCHTR